jgi:hypothetical protein
MYYARAKRSLPVGVFTFPNHSQPHRQFSLLKALTLVLPRSLRMANFRQLAKLLDVSSNYPSRLKITVS